MLKWNQIPLREFQGRGRHAVIENPAVPLSFEKSSGRLFREGKNEHPERFRKGIVIRKICHS